MTTRRINPTSLMYYLVVLAGLVLATLWTALAGYAGIRLERTLGRHRRIARFAAFVDDIDQECEEGTESPVTFAQGGIVDFNPEVTPLGVSILGKTEAGQE